MFYLCSMYTTTSLVFFISLYFPSHKFKWLNFLHLNITSIIKFWSYSNNNLLHKIFGFILPSKAHLANKEIYFFRFLNLFFWFYNIIFYNIRCLSIVYPLQFKWNRRYFALCRNMPDTSPLKAAIFRKKCACCRGNLSRTELYSVNI